MPILKNTFAPNGAALGFHKVTAINLTPEIAKVMVNSWVSEDAYNQGVRLGWQDTYEVPFSALSDSPFDSVETWLIEASGSPLEGGVIAGELVALEVARLRKYQEVRAARDAVEWGGVTVPGLGVFDSSEAGQRLVTGSVVLALLASMSGQTFTVAWTLLNNTAVTLNATQMTQIGALFGQHVAACYAAGRVAFAGLAAADTVEEIEAVSFTPPV